MRIVSVVVVFAWGMGCGDDGAGGGAGNGSDEGDSGPSGGGDGDGDGDGDGRDGGPNGGGDGDGDGDGERDAGPPRESCTASTDCDDALFCNGREKCLGGYCVAGDSVDCDDGVECTEDVCIEEGLRCESRAPDADSDGHPSTECTDGEGQPLGEDCDDLDGTRFPGNVEVCDSEGHDEDCDSDTKGDRDQDGDGFIDAACCNAVGSGFECGTDCDDLRPAVNTGADENCNGRDDDCDATIDEGALVNGFWDRDSDLHGNALQARTACPGTSKFSVESDDCDDMDPTKHGAQVEVCDGVDNDCDVAVDENPGVATWYRDADGDGFGSPAKLDGDDESVKRTVVSCEPVAGYTLIGTDCDDKLSGVNPAADEQCNGRDDDCNGLLDYSISTGDLEDDDDDGFADIRCARGNDCDDRSAASNPAATEVCDGIDNDCNGVADNGSQDAEWYPDYDGDGFGDPEATPIVACVPPRYHSIRAGDCDDSNPNLNPGATDVCNQRDEDCDGTLDEDAVVSAYYPDVDGDDFGGTPAVYACTPPNGMLSTGGDCDDTQDASNPDATEACNQVDDDCDGLTDEDFAVKTCGFGLCQKMVAECDASGEINACIPDPPAVPDQDQCDNLDDDCDGKIDEGASRFCDDAGTLGKCTSGLCEILACNAGYDDCNGFAPDGCEIDLLGNAAHCGECGNACAFGDTCEDGKCQNEPLSIAAGTAHTCAVLGSGDTYCWGLNSEGQSGSALSSGVLLKATKVASLGPAIQVASKVNHTCAMLQDRTAACWGDSFYYQLGNVSQNDSGTPIVVPGAASILGIEAGSAFTCWRSSTGAVYCFGTRCHNRLGHGNTSTDCGYLYHGAQAAQVAGLGATSQYSLGHAHGIARISGGNTSVNGWGYDGSGQLAVGGTATARGVAPLTYGNGTEATDSVDLATGANISCAALRTGKVVCSGADDQGQLGNDAALSASLRMVEAAGITDATRVWANYSSVCAQLEDETVWCWGRNDARQLHVDTAAAQQPVPIQMDDLPGQVVEMAVGEQHMCAILSTKRIACWGSNGQGQLGDNTGLARPGAVLVAGLP